MADLDAGRAAALAQWLARYGLARPLEAWKQAPKHKAADIAFRAICSEPRLLLTVPNNVARAIVGEAEKIVAEVVRTGEHASFALATAAMVVTDRIRIFRAVPNKHRRDAGEESPAGTPVTPDQVNTAGSFVIPEPYRAVWGKAFEDYPSFTEGTAAAVTGMVASIGPERLARLESPMGDLFAAVAARFVSRCARGLYPKSTTGAKDWLNIIQILGRYATITGRPLLAVGYDGHTGSYPDRARALAYDAMACVDLAIGGGLPLDPHLSLWEMAAEAHSYVSVALNPGIFRLMDFEKGMTLAAMAARFAQSALEFPDVFVVPELPAFLKQLAPQSVFATGLRFLPNGLPRRRSDPHPGMLPRQLVNASMRSSASDGPIWRPIDAR